MKPESDSIPSGEMLRANTAVALVLVAVLALALVAALAGMRAARNQTRAEEAEADSQNRLWNAYLAEARAVRISGEAGRRETALSVISNAAAFRISSSLRTEAIASLALSDLVQEGELLPVPRDLTTYDFDSDLSHYAYGDPHGRVTVGGFAGRSNLFTLAASEAGPGTRMNVANINFSPDGTRLAARFAGGAVALWDLQTRKVLTVINPGATNCVLSDLAFSPDSQRIIFTDRENNLELSVFEAATGRKLSSGADVGRSFFRLRPDERQVARVFRGGVELQDYPAGTNRQALAHFAPVYVLAWSPDGNLLATSCEDGDIYIWNLKQNTHRILHGHTERGINLGFSADGTKLFSSSLDGTTRLWDVSESTTIAIGDGVGKSLSPDGSRLGFTRPLLGFGAWRLVSNNNYQLFTCPRSEGLLLTVDLSVSGRWCVATQDKGFRLWDLQSANRCSAITAAGIYCVRVSPDERSLFLGGEKGLEVWPLTTNADGGVDLQPAGKQTVPLPTGLGARAFALSLDGRSAAVELTDHRMEVVDLAGARAPVVLKSRWRRVYFINGPATLTGAGRFAISPDGRWVATGYDFGGDETPRIWNARSGDLVTNLNADTSVVSFSPDGKWLGLAGMDHYSIWSVGDWRRKANYARDETSYVHGTIAFGSQAGLFAVVNTRQNVQLRSFQSDEKYFDLIGPEPQSVKSVRMALDASVLATATGNDMVQVWHLDRLQNELAGMNLGWQPLAASPQEPIVATGAGAGGLHTTLGLSLAGVVLAGAFAVMILRQHRASIARFISAEAEALQRNRELDMAKVELMHSQKMQALGTLATGIAHDFNNLLSVVRMSNKLIGRQAPGDTEIQEHVTDIEQAVLQGKSVVSSVLGYARAEKDDGEPTDVSAVVEDAVSLLSREFLSGIALTLELERDAPTVSIGRGPLEQILLNLVVNASEAMQGEGRLKIVVHERSSVPSQPCVLRPHSAGQYVELSVIDSGPGIAPEIRDRMFEPFFTTKRSGAKAGTGLGLSLVYSIAQQWGLSLGVESVAGNGARFTMLIPVESAPVRQTHSAKISNPA